MNKSQPKYSHGFYKKTLFLSVGAIAASVAILLSIFSILTYRSYLKSTVDSVAKQNETCYLQINSVLENCTRICMFFSQYQTASPVFQSNTSEKTKKLVLQKEISTFISCFDYIAGIYVDTGDYVMQGRITEPLNVLTSAGTYSSFDISYTYSEKWPHIIRIEYVPESSSFFHVYIDIFADYLSSQYFSENTFCISENGTILMTKDLSLLGQNLAKLKGASARELISSDSSISFKRPCFLSCLTMIVAIFIRQVSLSGAYKSAFAALYSSYAALMTSAYLPLFILTSFILVENVV